MNRRGFLGAILAGAVAPAVVRAASLMPWKATESGLLLPTGLIRGIQFDQSALNLYYSALIAEYRRDVDYYGGMRWSERDLAEFEARRPAHVVNLLTPADFE